MTETKNYRYGLANPKEVAGMTGKELLQAIIGALKNFITDKKYKLCILFVSYVQHLPSNPLLDRL
ncbi:MAG: hypothetical protein WCJ37_12740 [Syntrophus sp. (in: bacteria)]